MRYIQYRDICLSSIIMFTGRLHTQVEEVGRQTVGNRESSTSLFVTLTK